MHLREAFHSNHKTNTCTTAVQPLFSCRGLLLRCSYSLLLNCLGLQFQHRCSSTSSYQKVNSISTLHPCHYAIISRMLFVHQLPAAAAAPCVAHDVLATVLTVLYPVVVFHQSLLDLPHSSPLSVPVHTQIGKEAVLPHDFSHVNERISRCPRTLRYPYSTVVRKLYICYYRSTALRAYTYVQGVLARFRSQVVYFCCMLVTCVLRCFCVLPPPKSS